MGAVRHKGFIPWDTDIDIIVDIDSYQRFCEILQNELSTKFYLSSPRTNKNYESLKARIHLKNSEHRKIHIDIFPMVGAPQSKIGQKIFSKIAYINYRCYFRKKVNINKIYKHNIKKRILATILKIILLPIPSALIEKVFKILSIKFEYKTSEFICNICGSYGQREFIPKNWLGNPKYLEFEGYDFPVPQEWDKYLTHMYGDYMTPKKTNFIN